MSDMDLAWLINEWIAESLLEISKKLPSLVHEDPASFACGYNAGYKAATLDVNRRVQDYLERDTLIT